MSPILSASIISLIFILFFSFVSTRIDDSINWNWFLVFIPIFLLQLCFVIDCIILLIKNRVTNKVKLYKLSLFLISILLIYAFEIGLCLRLENYLFIKTTYLFIPLWIVLLILLIYLFSKLIK